MTNLNKALSNSVTNRTENRLAYFALAEDTEEAGTFSFPRRPRFFFPAAPVDEEAAADGLSFRMSDNF